MKFQVCAIYDSKARAFHLPMFFTNVHVACRAFADIANQEGHGICRNPEDYTLFHVAEWNDETGVHTDLSKQVNLGCASNYKKGT